MGMEVNITASSPPRINGAHRRHAELVNRGIDFTVYRTRDKAVTIYSGLELAQVDMYARLLRKAHQAACAPLMSCKQVIVPLIVPFNEVGYGKVVINEREETAPYTVARHFSEQNVSTFLDTQGQQGDEEAINGALSMIEETLQQQRVVAKPRLLWCNAQVRQNNWGKTLIITNLADSVLSIL